MSLLPKKYSQTLVSIELKNGDDYTSVATGFLVGYPARQNTDNDELYLVTNRHVFEDQPLVWLKFNHGESVIRYPLPLISEGGENLWQTHQDPDVDLAVIALTLEILNANGTEYNWIIEEDFATKDLRDELEIREGDEVFVLGFPLGIAGLGRKYAVARSGIISRLDDEILSQNKSFLIDCNIFPGNSGGPVILKPSMLGLEGEKPPVPRSYLLGIVSKYLPYTETAYTVRGRASIEFSENSGLALVVPIEFLDQIIPKLKPESSVEGGDPINESIQSDEVKKIKHSKKKKNR